jgi:hypothetical protein
MNAYVEKRKSRGEKYWNIYIFVVAIILIIAGFGKSMGLQQDVGFLSKTNSLVGFLTNRQLFSGVAFIEIAMAILLFSSSFSNDAKLKMVFWLSLQFLMYRGFLFLANEPAPCQCFGDIFGWLGMSEGAIYNMTTGAFFILIVPSAAWVFSDRIKDL